MGNINTSRLRSAEIEISTGEKRCIVEQLKQESARMANDALAVTNCYALEVFKNEKYRSELEFDCLVVKAPLIALEPEVITLAKSLFLFRKALSFILKSQKSAISLKVRDEIKELLQVLTFNYGSCVELGKRIGIRVSCKGVTLDEKKIQLFAKEFVKEGKVTTCPVHIDCATAHRNLAIMTECYQGFFQLFQYLKMLEERL